MKKIIILFLLLFVVVGCSNEGYGDYYFEEYEIECEVEYTTSMSHVVELLKDNGFSVMLQSLAINLVVDDNHFFSHFDEQGNCFRINRHTWTIGAGPCPVIQLPSVSNFSIGLYDWNRGISSQINFSMTDAGNIREILFVSIGAWSVVDGVDYTYSFSLPHPRYGFASESLSFGPDFCVIYGHVFPGQSRCSGNEIVIYNYLRDNLADFFESLGIDKEIVAQALYDYMMEFRFSLLEIMNNFAD